MAGRPLLSSARKAVLLAGVAHLAVSFAQTGEITCFGISGRGYTNNTRCPGSNACCGATATCLSNRLCHNVGDPPDLWIRGPCAVEGWDGMCGEICLYSKVPNPPANSEAQFR
ncbi:hypothetical protein B0T26DRAFT_717430 [Lasiosphaeria miniovina]|uniref:Uncharacterized protein n=1 Tax=Lasiosphaeria miniovina TaxID=1954250 RepID=A0AA40ACS0_9PEZI|nr:uncharacterized protein B0T26DRAFT_717430 [Lasiosphaeria miniovina]KAK0713432.1 hypothetical protein B0T26DRAFT_717430 [Lasiosphaeria miniovina]